MSIILEALKKASDRKTPPETVYVVPTPEKQAEPAERPITSISEIKDVRLSKTVIIMAMAVVVMAFAAFFTTNLGHEPTVKQASIPKVEKAAEGYAPPPVPSQPPASPKQEVTSIGSFLTRLSQPRLTLSGIVYGIGKPAAIIENKIVEEGGSIRGTKVVKIYSDKVEMLDEATGQTFTLKVD